MTAISRWRPTIGLSIVLSVYWVPILVGVRWGVWAGGDPIELATYATSHVAQEWAGTPVMTAALAPFVLASALLALLALIRDRATASTAYRHADIATLVLATPYLALGAWYLLVLGLFWIACSLHTCSLF